MIPRVYELDGYKLGRWIERQRAAYNGKISYSALDRERIEKLEQIGMVWRLELRDDWGVWYGLAEQYYREHGSLLIPGDYTVKEYRLGNWIREQRKRRKTGKMTAVQIRQLDQIGMAWKILETSSWEERYQRARRYYEQHGNLRVPTGYVTEEGFRLGQWICVQRERRSGKRRAPLQEREIALLDGIGMIWDVREKWEEEWNEMYAWTKAYREEHGRLPKRPAIKAPNGKSLGNWVNAQRGLLARKSLSEMKRKKLEEIGILPWRTGTISGQGYTRLEP